jgi:glycosyltransferase involved in cell wall biosynthesis
MNRHNEAVLAFQQGRVAEALRLLEELLAAEETAEVWNDWAAVQMGAGDLGKAETGFTRALELDSRNTDATANLGLLLLGKGDSVRALPLLTRVLPALPLMQQKLVEALLSAHVANKPSGGNQTNFTTQKLRILVVHEAFPDPKTGGLDLRVVQMLQTLRELGHEVTFAARERSNARESEALLLQAGILVYGDDSERLLCLGIESESARWSFREMVEQTSFDVAILVQSFQRSLSVPEQYLDDLRSYSRGTRIVVFTDELHVAPDGNDGTDLLASEQKADLALRQWETFQRADVVAFPNQGDAAMLRDKSDGTPSEVVGNDLQSTTLAKVLQSILAITPKDRAEECCSVMQVEALFQERLAGKTGESRRLKQLECYVRFAEQLLAEGKPEKAHEQVRHVFGRAPELMRAGYFASQVFMVLKRCYRKLGNLQMAERCAAESRRRITMGRPALAQRSKRPGAPIFSVIVPTYNRLPILKKCLSALEGQTLAAKDFEVIVIDDGSSDGTEQLLTHYRPPFHFQYLRQKNSGTGAARRNGVAHASGAYLLLMNDDTICDRDLLEQHLQVQQAYPGERWAVLGNFEYPAAARQRALTRYFCVEPFMFPQVSMEEGCPYGYSHFITCNLSVHREAVVEVGSFDSIYKLSEDTEMGLRLYEKGYRVLYHPDAHAFHDHLPYPARNLIRRARVYGADYFYMFGRHPRVMREWAMPITLTAMDQENAICIQSYVEEHRQEVEEAVEAVERWDSIDFEPFLTDRPETAAMVLKLFQQAVPAIHWFYLFETMLHTMIRELGLNRLTGKPRAMHAAQGAGH